MYNVILFIKATRVAQVFHTTPEDQVDSAFMDLYNEVLLEADLHPMYEMLETPKLMEQGWLWVSI